MGHSFRAKGPNVNNFCLKQLATVINETKFVSRSVKEFVETMVRLGDAMGCTIRRPQLHQLQNDRTATYVDACNRVISPNTQVCVLNNSARSNMILFTHPSVISIVQSRICVFCLKIGSVRASRFQNQFLIQSF